MDETRVELDMTNNITIDIRGVKFVPIQNTNSENKAYSVVLSVLEDGTKFPPLIIFNGVGKNIGPTLKTTSSKFTFSGNKTSAYQNGSTFKFWFDDVWDESLDQSVKTNCLLLMDSCGTLHKSYCPEGTNTMFFPPNTTSKLQPLDLAINHPFKLRLRAFWEEWISIELANDYTNSGYRRQVPRQTFIEWVEAAWAEISEETIINSFSFIRNKLDSIFNQFEIIQN